MTAVERIPADDGTRRRSIEIKRTLNLHCHSSRVDENDERIAAKRRAITDHSSRVIFSFDLHNLHASSILERNPVAHVRG
jgi:hypothetical protein